MKGIVNAAATAAVALLVVIGVGSFSVAYQSQTIIKNANERNNDATMNQIEFIKKAIHQSGFYSAYQEIYSLAKYGGYTTYNGECDQSSIEGYPDGIPYWRVFDEKCLTNPTSLFRVKLQDSIFKSFLENLASIKNNLNDSRLTMPEYGSIDTFQIYDDDIQVEISATAKLKFVSEKIEISDNVGFIDYIPIPLGKILNFAKEKFIDADSNILDPLIEDANLEMEAVDYSGKKVNCKKIELIDPANYCGRAVDKTKEQMLSERCSGALDKFEDKIVSKIENHNLNPPSGITATLSTSKTDVKSSVDSGNEGTCESSSKSNYTDCACIRWECSVGSPVVVGDSIKERPLVGHAASEGDSCAPCTSTYTTTLDEDSVVTMCVQFENKVCPNDYPTEFNGQCVKLADKVCKSTERMINNNCYSSICLDEGNDLEECKTGQTSCPAGHPVSYDATRCRTDQMKVKLCPSSAPVEKNERCYASPTSSPTCAEKDTLYTKTCEYNYNAEVATKAVIGSDRQYPIYDIIERDTSQKHIDLELRILSKN